MKRLLLVAGQGIGVIGNGVDWMGSLMGVGDDMSSEYGSSNVVHG